MTTKNKPVKAAKKQVPSQPSKPAQSAKKPVKHEPVKATAKQPSKPAQKVAPVVAAKPKRPFIIKKDTPATPVVDAPTSTLTEERKEKMKREFEEANKVEGNARDLQELPIISFYRTTDFLKQMRNTKL